MTTTSLLFTLPPFLPYLVARSGSEQIISLPVVSSTLRQLDTLTQSGTLINVATRTPHGYLTGAIVNMRVGGWNATTMMQHPANGAWTVTVVDDLNFLLNASTWVAADVFLHGFCYTGSLTDARPEITRLSTWLDDRGHGHLQFPHGGVALTTGDPAFAHTAVSLPANVELRGHGKNHSFIVCGDNLNCIPLQSIGTSRVKLRRFTLYGNRQNQGVGGYHAVRFGHALSGGVTEEFELEDVNLFGSAGYGVGCQGEGAFKNCILRRVWVNECDNDATDWKNRDDANFGNSIEFGRYENSSLAQIGTNSAPSKTLGSNPIATTSGSATVVFTEASHARYTGQIITISGATAVAGLTMNGSFRITAITGSTWSVSAGSTANATTTGGGAAVVVVAPVNEGDSVVDLRGPFQITSPRILIAQHSCTGLLMRSGQALGANGEGAKRSTITGVKVTVRSDLLNPISVNGIALSGDDIALSAFEVDGPTTGLNIAAVAKNIAVTGGAIKNCGTYGSWVQGEQVSLVGINTRACGTNFYVDGGSTVEEGGLATDPFTTVLNSTTVTVSFPAHGHSNGDSITLFDVDDFNGVIFREGSASPYTIANVTTNTFTITVTANATASGAGGGDNVSYQFPGVTHNTDGVKLIGCTSEGAVTTGYQLGTKSVGTTIMGCHSAATDAVGLLDADGTSRVGPGNTGLLPNKETVVQLPTDGTSTVLTVADLGKTYLVSSATTVKAPITLPTITSHMIGSHVRFMVFDTDGIRLLAGGSALRILGVATTANSSTGGLECTTIGGCVTFRAETTGIWAAEASLGTWTLVP